MALPRPSAHGYRHSIRFKLIASLICVSLFIGLVSLAVGGNLIYRSVIDETRSRIRQDLNSAWVIYNSQAEALNLALELITSPQQAQPCPRALEQDLALVAQTLDLDFFGITDPSGKEVAWIGSESAQTSIPLSAEVINPFVRKVMNTEKPVSGTAVISAQDETTPNPEGEVLSLGTARPLYVDNTFAGVMYAGIILDPEGTIIPRIMATVFDNETYEGRPLGTATIFSRDRRIATSVADKTGQLAIGTTASREVSAQVLESGRPWVGRAKVVDEWHISAYDPIHDIFGNRVGMLYVGVLEKKFKDVRKKAVAVFTGITLAGVFMAVLLGWIFTGRIMQPVSRLIRASAQISKGNFSPEIGPVSKGDIGVLQKEFSHMIQALKQREARQKQESEHMLFQSQKQASIGRLAAGVAHEINNPLTAVLTFTHLILKNKQLDPGIRQDLEMVASQTERVRQIVKGLLQFSRQTQIQMAPLDLNTLIEETLALLRNQARAKDLELWFSADPALPVFHLDKNQFQSVLINLVINAIDATESGGKIQICTQSDSRQNTSGANIRVSDTGSGIDPELMDKLFDPFFTTKPVGKGTGLGLAVSQGIVQRHNGTIRVTSAPGQGTTFTIWLPAGPDYPTQDI